jgi:hypothetical protein
MSKVEVAIVGIMVVGFCAILTRSRFQNLLEMEQAALARRTDIEDALNRLLNVKGQG